MPSFNFFLGAVSEIQEVQFFGVFPTWLPHHVTYDVRILIKTFYMSSRSNGEKLFSMRQAVAEKNTKVLCGQTDKQTDKPVGGDGSPSMETIRYRAKWMSYSG